MDLLSETAAVAAVAAPASAPAPAAATAAAAPAAAAAAVPPVVVSGPQTTLDSLTVSARESVAHARKKSTKDANQSYLRRFKQYLAGILTLHGNPATIPGWRYFLLQRDGSELTEAPDVGQKIGSAQMRYFDRFILNFKTMSAGTFTNFLDCLKSDGLARGGDGLSMAYSSLAKFRTAVGREYKEASRSADMLRIFGGDRIELPADWDELLEEFMKGKKNDQAKEREAGLRKAKEGSDALPFAAFDHLCQKLVSSKEDNALFSLAFMVLAWNLCCRMDEVNCLHTRALGYADDALTVLFYKSKMDMGGEYTKSFHCYGNVDKPHTCIVTVLAMWFSVQQHRSVTDAHSANPPIFPSSKSQDDFNATVKALWRDPAIAEEMRELFAVNIENLTAYMTRKGSTTALTSDCVDPPSQAAVFIRAKWTQGVRDRYLQYGAAGDQRCGRIVAGYDSQTPSYANLPWHFVSMDDEIRGVLEHQFFNDCKVGCMDNVLPHLLAALVGNFDYLNATLPAQSPLRNTYVFTLDPREVSSLKRKLVNPRDFTYKMMRRTGIPSSVCLLLSLEDVKRQVATVSRAVREDLVPQLTAAMAKQIEEAGVQSGNITQAWFQDQVKLLIEELGARESAAAPIAPAPAPEPAETIIRMFDHPDGTMRRVPPDFLLPGKGTSVALCWRLWFLGNPRKGICPFRDIAPKSDLGSFTLDTAGQRVYKVTAQQRTYSTWTRLMGFLVNKLDAEHVAALQTPSASTVKETWEMVAPFLYDHVKFSDDSSEGDKYRKKIGSQTVHTAYEYVFKKRKHGSEAPPGDRLIHRRKKRRSNATAAAMGSIAAAPSASATAIAEAGAVPMQLT
eukprot:CAMPEP_0206312312 /NCGR_PEP_ID=MMETSP0106_2-20121207/13923_1 /ASSEMBLY_ACC=CAM_ASM_000206 /TAXON_ID=81532 /ORGANISM="Acanthoeca-like sp., Strain 10tr" /LENGTH=845 /DNA_ID=CAMNT_0053743605 /DNA_START=176 /DNA_END=2713 /DNA_ORIENTATION=+